MARQAWGDAIVTVSEGGTALAFFFPDPRLGPPGGPEQFPAPPDRDDPVRRVRVAARRVEIADLDEPPGSFAAAIAVVSLHHVDPLEESCRRLGELVEPGGTLVVDEFDVGAFDVRAAAWWLEQRRALGETRPETPEELVAEHRNHLHPLDRVVAALAPHFELGPPIRGPWLHRWDLGESLRAVEEEAVARGTLPATGARLVGRRGPQSR